MLQPADTASELRLQDKLRQRHAHLTEPLDTLYTLFLKPAAGRERTGAMDFDSIETRMVFGKTGRSERLCRWCEMMHIV